MSEYQNWLVTVESHVATLTLDRAGTMNTFTEDTLDELEQISIGLRASHDVWAVIVEASGDHFSQGMDLDAIREISNQTEPEFRKRLRKWQRGFDEFESINKPTIAKIKGFCIGAGVVFALCCDFRIASQRTIFHLPEVKFGGVVAMGTQRLVRTVGVAAAKEMILLGERFNAQAALVARLIQRVVPADELDAAADRWAGKFRQLPPPTVSAANRVIDASYHLTCRECQDLEIDVQDEIRRTDDFQEALSSYVGKRRPRFTGG